MINFDEPGMLNRRVRILRYKETVDEYGLTHQTLEDVFGGPIWALIEPARGHTYYEQYRDIIYGNKHAEGKEFARFRLLETSSYQNIPRSIQNVFLNSRLDANFIKDII